MSFGAVVIGGGGHVGLPLAIMLSSRGVNTAIYDISKSAVEGINAGKMHFWEPGAEKLLQESIAAKKNNCHDRPVRNRRNGLPDCGHRDAC